MLGACKKLILLLVASAAVASIVPSVVLAEPTPLSSVNPNSTAKRVNRMTLLLGEVYFYAQDTTGAGEPDSIEFTAVNSDCPARISVKREDAEGNNVQASVLTYTEKVGDACAGAEKTKGALPVEKWYERAYNVFAQHNGKVYSVNANDTVPFTKQATVDGKDIYIQGTDPTVCPAIVLNVNPGGGGDWRLLPLIKFSELNISVAVPREQKVAAYSSQAEVNAVLKKIYGSSADNADCVYPEFGQRLDDRLRDYDLPGDYYKGRDGDFVGFNFGKGTTRTIKLEGMPGLDGIGLAGAGPNADLAKLANSRLVSTKTTAEKNTCKIDAVGWLVCPVAGFIGKITDGAYATIEKLLVYKVSNEPFSTDPSINPVYTVWSNVRNFANMLFIIAFFAVILSQATSIGISAYGIRKLLPRIIAAAILVNLSYYICLFVIDVSNILGAGVDGLIRSVPLTNLNSNNNATWETVTTNVLSGTLLAGGAIAAGIAFQALLGVVLPFLAFALLTAIVTLVILVARQAVLTLLIIISPLIFVAYILPGTEKFAKKGMNLFFGASMMYVAIAALFAGSQVGADILMATNKSDNGFLNFLIVIFALAMKFFVLGGVPYIAKQAGGGFARLAGIVNDRGKGMIDRARNYGKEKDTNNAARLARWSAGKRAQWHENGGKPSGGRVKRGFSRMTAGAAGLGGRKYRKDLEKASRAEESKRALEDAYYGGLREKTTDANGVGRFTPRAERWAKRAAGVGYGKDHKGTDFGGIERVRQRATEQELKRSTEDRTRVAVAHSNAGMYGKGTYYIQKDDGTGYFESTNTGLALAAQAAGKKVGVVKAGVKPVKIGNDGMAANAVVFDGGDDAVKYASMAQIAKTGDGAAYGYVMHGAEEGGKIIQKALSDEDYNDFMQFMGDNTGGVVNAIPQLIKGDNALSGMTAEKLSLLHGTGMISIASRIRQLKDSTSAADRANGEKYEKALLESWNAFQKDPLKASMRSAKLEGDFGNAMRIITGHAPRKALREYGDTLDSEHGTIKGYTYDKTGPKDAPNIDTQWEWGRTFNNQYVPHKPDGTPRTDAEAQKYLDDLNRNIP